MKEGELKLIMKEGELKTVKTNVNRPGLNGRKLGSCKLRRKLEGGKEHIYKNEIFTISQC